MKKCFVFIAMLLVSTCSVFAAPKTVCASHILVNTEKEALNLKENINTYNDFRMMARRYSKCPSSQNSGDLGCFQKGQMVKEFENAAFNGEIGQVIGPVKTQFGYHLLWVTNSF